MDIDKLIKELKFCARLGDSPIMEGFAVIADKRKLEDAADALSALQAENEKLRYELDHLKAEWDKYQPKEHWETLNELCKNLHDKLEQVKRERDAAVGTIYALIADCSPEVCKEICANHDGVCSKRAEMNHYDHCKGFKWIGEMED